MKKAKKGNNRRKPAWILSERVRIRAIECLKIAERPMSANEILKWLKHFDLGLYVEISARCQDYLRVILGKTDGITKFTRNKPFFGIDRRTKFFGLSNAEYPLDVWCIDDSPLENDPIDEKIEEENSGDDSIESIKQVEKPKIAVLPSIIPNNCHDVSDEELWSEIVQTLFSAQQSTSEFSEIKL